MMSILLMPETSFSSSVTEATQWLQVMPEILISVVRVLETTGAGALAVEVGRGMICRRSLELDLSEHPQLQAMILLSFTKGSGWDKKWEAGKLPQQPGDGGGGLGDLLLHDAGITTLDGLLGGTHHAVANMVFD